MRRLSRVASSGASGEGLVAAAAEFVDTLQKAGLNADAMREAVTAVVADVVAGEAAAEQFANEAETGQQQKAARRQVGVLRALRKVLTVMAERIE